MANYYYLITALPELSLGSPPELSFKELKEMLILNLTPDDLKAVSRLLRPIDLYNIRALWLGYPLDDRGNYNAKDLEEALLVGDLLPEYLINFLERYESTADRLRYFASLYASLYREAMSDSNRFLRQIYEQEREIRLVLTALRSKRLKADLVRELQFEDPSDPFVAGILAQKDAPEYTPPREYEDLKMLFVENFSDPQKLNRAILEYRFEKIEEMEDSGDFTINRVLSYIARFILVESLESGSPEKGMTIVEQLSRYG